MAITLLSPYIDGRWIPGEWFPSNSWLTCPGGRPPAGVLGNSKTSAETGRVGVRVLVVGGTGFIGVHVVARLLARGHHVGVMHRWLTNGHADAAVTHLIADERDADACHRQATGFAPDVIINMILGDEAAARRFLSVCNGVTGRTVVVSSMDVYRAYDRYRKRQPGPPDPVPLSEDGPLRDRLYPYLPEGQSPQADEYDKILVERAMSSDPAIPCTVVRLPMVYGPGDRQHRFHPWLRRMWDGRPAILMSRERAAWRVTFGYVDDVADAIAGAAVDPRAAGRVYNAGDRVVRTQREWVERLAGVVGWAGSVVEVPEDRLPPHLFSDRDCRQDWVVDTSRIRGELRFLEPTAPDEALRRTTEWEFAHPPQGAEGFDYGAEDAVLQSI